MLQDKFMFTIDELVAEFTAKVIAEKDAEFAKKAAEIEAEYAKKEAEKNQELAKKMILNGESLDKIEVYTGMNIAALDPIAHELGKKLQCNIV
ncbi:MAG: hypothetical protein IJL67_10030 [Oscillospiraceae bacterium]|nr:hypothetical protein [Oscillospiraceae bacterium]